MKKFEDKFMEVQASMISLALEYVQNQSEKVYIYCISEEALLSFDVFIKSMEFMSNYTGLTLF
ncbi:conserved domain protein [Streptococcus infantis X]|uniref:Conserved domain protein n=1 Tax=Streptococcus infantis X TaxID=997830 RepID=F9PE53_9STRE|nr:conserved domain protein [Streptococcus infantis X]